MNYAKLTSDLPVNVVMALNREEIFESESEGDDDEIEEFQESSGDVVVIINELKRDGKNQECIDPKLKNPVLFVHKKEFALNYAKLTSDLPVNVEEIFESESEGDDDEIEEFQESSGDEVVIIN